MKYTAATLIFLAASLTFSQISNSIPETLAGHLKKMKYYKYESFNPDSVEAENKLFKSLLLKYLNDDPGTLKSNMDIVVKEGLIIAGSDDILFRIYSWDTETGGTMHFYNNIYQYSSGNNVYVKELVSDTEGDPGAWYSEIYTINNNGKTYYMGIFNSEYSTSEIAQGINFFSINNGSLDAEVKLAKTAEGNVNTLWVNFNFFKLKGHDERPLKIVTYNTGSKTISIPVVSSEGALTGKFTFYKFSSGLFEEIK